MSDPTPKATTHTPPPWEAEITGMSPVKILANDRRDVVGYAIYGPRANVDAEHAGGVPVAEANARVMAAAPDLYDACKLFLKACRCVDIQHHGFGRAFNAAMAAVKKAEAQR